MFKFNINSVPHGVRRGLFFTVVVIVILHFVPNGEYRMAPFPEGIIVDRAINDIQMTQMESYGRNIHSMKLGTKCHDYFNALESTGLNFGPKRGQLYPHENTDMIRHVKSVAIYNACFIDEDVTLPASDLEQQIYPFLSFKYPLYNRWDGDTYTIPPSSNGRTYLANFKDHLEGSGIVVSISDEFVSEIVDLLVRLRTVGNELPIQLMYRNDLSDANKGKILAAARGDTYNTGSSTNESDAALGATSFPPQDIWFVNIYPCIAQEYRNEFQKYFEKELAYLFSSFANTILLDADVVLFQKPSTFFESAQFKKTGTLFFKDRYTPMRMSDRWVDFVRSAVPTPYDSILYGLSQSNLSDEYLNNRYFHYQEAGVVVVDRKRHFARVALTPHLSQLESTFIASWGDKEHFFLAFLLGGANYSFNSHWAGAVGAELEETIDGRVRVCSAHPAHFNGTDNTLMWINSGSKVCPLPISNVDAQDLEFWEPRGVENLSELEYIYMQNLDIRVGLVPPNAPEANEQLSICGKRVWCAYKEMGNKPGTVVSFTPAQSAHFSTVLNASAD